jgi:AraC-like DNA-binding protein
MRPLLDDTTFRRLCRARDFGHACFTQPITTAALAREAALSHWHFHRLFTGAFGTTPHDFLTTLRFEHAKRLLADGNHSVTDACFLAGYSSLGSFSTRFHKSVGCSPADYQRRVRRVFGSAAVQRVTFIPTCWLGYLDGHE